MSEFKKHYLGKYKLGGGFGSWAQSFENGVEPGEVRFIGGLLMYAYTVYHRRFSRNEVNWCPVDREVCHDANQFRLWVNS